MKITTIIIALIFPMASYAASSNLAYIAEVEPLDFYGAKAFQFGVVNPPADVCSDYGRHFIFDATTPEGKNMLSVVLAAKVTKTKINIWYTPSTTPGSDQNSGCNVATMAIVDGVGIK